MNSRLIWIGTTTLKLPCLCTEKHQLKHNCKPHFSIPVMKRVSKEIHAGVSHSKKHTHMLESNYLEVTMFNILKNFSTRKIIMPKSEENKTARSLSTNLKLTNTCWGEKKNKIKEGESQKSLQLTSLWSKWFRVDIRKNLTRRKNN